jgi:hypothetical protein
VLTKENYPASQDLSLLAYLHAGSQNPRNHQASSILIKASHFLNSCSARTLSYTEPGIDKQAERRWPQNASVRGDRTLYPLTSEGRIEYLQIL